MSATATATINGEMTQTDRPVFILGCPRSGTSLLSRILNNHPRIAIPYESHLYNTFYPWREKYGDLAEPARARRLIEDIYATDVFHDWDHTPDIDAVLAARTRDDIHGVFEAILTVWAAHHDKPRWGEKTPQHAVYWHTIRAAFPNALVIHMVRDVRDVAVSWVASRFGPKHPVVAAEQWCAYLETMETVCELQGEAGCHTIRYVDLVTTPQAELARLCDFLGELYDPLMLDFYKQRFNYRTDARNTAQLHAPLNPSSVGRWKTRVKPRHLGVIEAIAGERMRRFGYEPETACPSDDTPASSTGFYRACNKMLRLKSKAVNTKGWVDGYRRMKIRARLALRPPR